MPLLKLCWRWTVSELQGQSIEVKVLSDLGGSEKEHVLTDTSFSRITKFGDFGLIVPSAMWNLLPPGTLTRRTHTAT